MKKIIGSLIISFSFFFNVSISFSQPLSKGEFRQLFTQGNLMILDQFYDTAVRTFLRLNTTDPSNANVNYKIGYCYLHLPADKLKSIAYLENAIKQTTGSYREDESSERNAPEDAIYLLGRAYHYAYRFDEAIVQFQKFRELVGKWNLNLVKEIDHWVEISKNAKELTAKPVECSITNLGDSINSEFPDYSPVISADEAVLIFTSRREGTGGPGNVTIDDDFFEDIWICYRSEYGTWTKAKGISRTINTDFNEATIGLSADGQQLYVYRDDGSGTSGDIYISKLDGDYWNSPYKMEASGVNSPDWEPSACISADGNTMYFVSNRPGGLGGRDIYESKRLPNRSWSTPENLGPTINTQYDEDAPFVHPDGMTFFFSSTGHNSMGGFDVFYSTKVAKNVWTTPMNIGYPINTTDDDIYFVTSSDGRRAYYASFRPEGKGEKDIYLVNMPNPFVKSVAIMVGWLKNRDGSAIPKSSSVIVKPSKQGEIISAKPNEATGKFVMSMFPGQEYEITIEANNNKVYTDTFFLPEDSSYQSLGRGFFQRTIYMGDTTRLFSMNPVMDTSSRIQMIPMDGKILLSENPNDVSANATIALLNSQGNIISTAITDSKGQFKFQNIPSGQNYIIKIDENDPVLKTNSKFYLADNMGKIITPSTQEGRFFLFKNINPDINKITPLESADTAKLSYSAMIGRLLSGIESKDAVANATINLLDEKGKVIQTKTTDKKGNFSFENIPSDKNYTISIQEDDPSLKNNSQLFLVNQQNEVIKKVEKASDHFVFENLPADLSKLKAIDISDSKITAKINDAKPATKKDTAVFVRKENKYTSEDDKFDFVVYFPYNKKEINISIGSYLSLMEKVEKTVTANGTAEVIIASSSSKVPTKTFSSNEELANARAEEVKDKIRASLSLKNLDPAKINYHISAKVQGPDYQNDAVQKRKEYERWQFVKVIVK